MLISFTGCQSSGKTTLLKHLQEYNSLNTSLRFIPEVTRLVRREYNVPINENGNDLTQMLISSYHLINCMSKQNDNCVTILDRCSLDGLVYTHYLTEIGQTSMSAYIQSKTIYDATKDYYNIIFYTDPNDVPLMNDGERSVDVTFRNRIIELFDQYLETHDRDNVVVVKGTVEERLDIIKTTLAKNNIDINI